MTPPLTGYRVGITSARKIGELTALLERRGASVESAPALTITPVQEDGRVRAATQACVDNPPDILVATTGIGMRSWLAAATTWGMSSDLLASLGKAVIIARGPKAVGALRAHGLQELWSPESECFEDVLDHLRRQDLAGKRIVVQEHGQSLSVVADALRRRGAEVEVVTVYRCDVVADSAPVFRMVDRVADRRVDAVTFTSAPAVEALIEVAAAAGRRSEVLEAFRCDVLATCVGPVTAAPFGLWGVPVIQPSRARLAAMVKELEVELPARREGISMTANGHRLLMRGDAVIVDGVEVRLSPGPRAVFDHLVATPGKVVSRKQLLSALPRGSGSSEHAVEVAVARLRERLGAAVVQTVVKRGYRLAVP